MSSTDIMELKNIINCHLGKSGSTKKFLGSIYSDIEGLNKILRYFADEYNGKADAVAAIDGSGYIIGGMIARQLKIPFIPVVKESTHNDFGDEFLRSPYIDHRDKARSLIISKELLKKASRVLIVDNWIETGVTIRTALSIMEEAEVAVAGIAAFGVDSNPITDGLKKDVGITAIIEE